MQQIAKEKLNEWKEVYDQLLMARARLTVARAIQRFR
jgi:hypothetical protein